MQEQAKGELTLPDDVVLLSTHIKDADAGIAIRRSRGYIISVLQAPEMGWKGWTSGGHTHKKKVVPKKTNIIQGQGKGPGGIHLSGSAVINNKAN